MSTFRNPVGPQSSSVYWRRRLIVGLGLVAVIAIILLIVFGPKASSGPASTSPSAEPSAVASSAPAATNASGAVICDPAKLTLDAATDETTYDENQNPQLSFSITSTMTEPCAIEAGSDIQEFVITSGDDEIWNSTHCQTEGEPRTIELQPGVEVKSSTIEWDRTRSATDTCESDRPAVSAGGASYHLEVTVGDISSESTKQFLLN
ncbi:hypothetical protein ESZ53_07700 [Salinibacterium sp. UTAS2018]|uniref:hypothetical protein n=1 Tax=Salinibacterium sp. UTAS2018 TaxID=2508880 RepID=UPI0010095DA5|nr:hypothetical protein [Salinibacterium sp. UTAS2018]QAV70336.1 hypothetical protein ESZ53_07700 [Salinibacterium sp. UTAS2018]